MLEELEDRTEPLATATVVARMAIEPESEPVGRVVVAVY